MDALERAEACCVALKGRVDTDVEARLLIGLATAQALATIAAELRDLGAESFPLHVREV